MPECRFLLGIETTTFSQSIESVLLVVNLYNSKCPSARPSLSVRISAPIL